MHCTSPWGWIQFKGHWSSSMLSGCKLSVTPAVVCIEVAGQTLATGTFSRTFLSTISKFQSVIISLIYQHRYNTCKNESVGGRVSNVLVGSCLEFAARQAEGTRHKWEHLIGTHLTARKFTGVLTIYSFVPANGASKFQLRNKSL